MKSSELFWDQIAAYHENFLYIEIVMLLIGIVLTILIFRKPSPLKNNLMKIYLALSFGFQAFVFFWRLDKSPMGRYFAGPLFLAIAILFLVDIKTKKTEFMFPLGKMDRIMLFILWGLVLIGYPVISYLFGHRYPAITTPFMPCPLTVFALSLMCAALPRVDIKAYWLLLVWAALGLPKVFGLFNVREDTILFLTGVYAFILLLKNFPAMKQYLRSPK